MFGSSRVRRNDPEVFTMHKISSVACPGRKAYMEFKQSCEIVYKIEEVYERLGLTSPDSGSQVYDHYVPFHAQSAL